MKRLVFAVVLSLAVVVETWAQGPVYFADPALKASVENTLWVSDPTSTDMLALTSLYAEMAGITDLTGLEHALNLQTLDLAHNEIDDVSALSGLSNLQTLSMNTNQVHDLTPLSSLSALQTLDMHDNQISDISPLSGLTDLRSLTLRINQISDLSPLAGLTKLTTLVLENNQISDISILAGLSHLSYVRLGFNQISDLSALAGLNELTFLQLHNNQISDISVFSGLGQMQSLSLSGNQISDISALAHLTSLSYLALEINPLNQAAYDIYLPQIIANNPGIYITYDDTVSDGLRLSVTSSTGGSVISPGEGEFIYSDGNIVRLEAEAEPGFVFVRWSGSYTGTANPTYLVMDQDHQVHAEFSSTGQDVFYVEDDAPGDPGPQDANVSDPEENGTADHPFDMIQEAIDAAADGMTVIVRPGTYREQINLLGKKIQLTGIDPGGLRGASLPVIDGGSAGPVVTFAGGEDPNCVLMGFVITGGRSDPAGAVICSGSSPMIANCLIVGNRAADINGAAIYCADSNAVFVQCTIAGNAAGQRSAALYMVDSHIILTNSILWNNYPSEILVGGTSKPMITYADITGGWPDRSNIDVDPLFAQPGWWADPNDPTVAVEPDVDDAVWMDGDYHLASEAGRWDPVAQDWVGDKETSPCIDAGDPTDRVGEEPVPNGGAINLGVYGGTTDASKTP